MAMKRALLAGGLSGLVFLAYLRWAVPWIEGQAADQVPRFDLLGSLRVEQPGAWLSLFPPDAWQRDEAHRNMIQADGNIVLFQNFAHEPEGGVRVQGLTLLLFDSAAGDRPDREALPMVVESIDEAVLSFDARQASGLDRYGDLKRIEFLGQVKFWKRGALVQDSFALETDRLTITGSQATTESALRFQFGESSGRATGLELTFENPESLHLANATVTKIAGLRHLRLGQVQQLDLRSGMGRELEGRVGRESRANHFRLSCAGPAEFSFSQRTARFHDTVRVFDFGTRCWLTGRALLVKFAPPTESGPAESGPTELGPGAKTPGQRAMLPDDMVARELWLFGAPAAIIHETQAYQLTAATLQFQVEQQEFVAGALPLVGSEPWMQDATQGGPGEAELFRDRLWLRTPQLRYRMTAGAGNPATPAATATELGATELGATELGATELGTMEAMGPGELWYGVQDQSAPLQLQWEERMTLAPDREDPERLMISLLGGTRAALDARSNLSAESLYFWLQQSSEAGLSLGSQSRRWEPDLVLARGHVRFAGEQMRAAVHEARVYFPPGRQLASENAMAAASGDRSGQHRPVGLMPTDMAQHPTARIRSDAGGVAAAIGGPNSAEEGPPAAAPPALLSPSQVLDLSTPVASPVGTAGAGPRGSDITAESLILQLAWADPPDPPSAALSSPSATRPVGGGGARSSSDPDRAKYRLQTIDLEGQVVVEERVGDDAGPTNPASVPDERVSAYRLLGHRIVGVAADEASDGVAGGLAGAKSPRFVWTLSALPGQMARLDNAEFELLAPEVHFDQQQNLAWTMRPGTLSFLVPHDAALPHPGEVVATRPASSVGPAAAGHSQIAPAAATQPDGMPGADPGPGRGTAKWQKGFQFDGRQLLLDGQVEWQIERPKPAGLTEQIRGFGERMAIELSETVAVGTGSPSAARPTAQRIQMSSGAGPGDQGDPAPIKLYLEQRAADRSLVAHEVIWASDMQVNLPQNTFHFSGPGSLWSVRAEPPVRQPISSGPDLATELTYLKVQFQRSMDGQWVEGIVNLAGPVSALYGKATGWEILENESRLRSPLKIHSDSMSLNRWQPTPEAAFELEWEADGRVHVWGEQFVGTARAIKYAQTQDLLTLRGDSRGPAKFWQTTPGTTTQNHLAAQKIWYRPKNEDFHFEGFQEGNLNFFSGRRGGVDPEGSISPK